MLDPRHCFDLAEPSETWSWKTYVPATEAVKVACADVAPESDTAGPDVCVHE